MDYLLAVIYIDIATYHAQGVAVGAEIPPIWTSMRSPAPSVVSVMTVISVESSVLPKLRSAKIQTSG